MGYQKIVLDLVQASLLRAGWETRRDEPEGEKNDDETHDRDP
jgi:hypothetical protein